MSYHQVKVVPVILTINEHRALRTFMRRLHDTPTNKTTRDALNKIEEAVPCSDVILAALEVSKGD